jgi:RNA polymerase sigma-70 factor (ECF subfamily)
MEFNGDRDPVLERDQTLQRALNGDQEALGCLLASHMPKLYRIALGVLGTPQDAEEALQDGLLGAVRHLGEFECWARFSTWLTRIVINTALMRLRKSHREVLMSIDQKLDRDEVALADRITDPGPNPEEMYARKERLQILERTLRSLSEAHRSVLWLRDVQGMSTKEAAETLGLNTATVKTQLHRARLKLGKAGCKASPRHRTLQDARSELGTTGHRPTVELMAEVANLTA